VKRSGRDEPMWVVIHMCMETTLGISVQLSLSQTSKNAMSLLYLLCFLFNKIGKQEGQTDSAQNQEGGGNRRSGEVAQTMYTNVSKCKNDKRKKNK
jgi:hypothetical protein